MQGVVVKAPPQTLQGNRSRLVLNLAHLGSGSSMGRVDPNVGDDGPGLFKPRKVLSPRGSSMEEGACSKEDGLGQEDARSDLEEAIPSLEVELALAIPRVGVQPLGREENEVEEVDFCGRQLTMVPVEEDEVARYKVNIYPPLNLVFYG